MEMESEGKDRGRVGSLYQGLIDLDETLGLGDFTVLLCQTHHVVEGYRLMETVEQHQGCILIEGVKSRKSK